MTVFLFVCICGIAFKHPVVLVGDAVLLHCFLIGVAIDDVSFSLKCRPSL